MKKLLFLLTAFIYLTALNAQSPWYTKNLATYMRIVRTGTNTKLQIDTTAANTWADIVSGTDVAGINAIIANNTIVKNTISQLRALTSVVAAQAFYLNDPNIGGVFYYDATDATSADDGVNIIVTSGGARLKRISDIPQFSSVAAMRASSQYLRKLPIYSTLSYYGDGDLASTGYFRFSDTSTHADDSCLYIKPAGVGAGAGRYVYIPTSNQYNLRALGNKADNSTDISWRTNYVLDNIPFGSTAYLPSGTYYSAFTLNIPSVARRLLGDQIHGSTINFPASMIGIKILKQNGGILQHGFQTLENLFINANAKDGTDGVDQYSVASSPYCETWYRYHGIEVENVCNIINVYVANFSGNGVNYYGSLAAIGANVSGAYAENLHVKQCNGAGVGISGGDANYINLQNLDLRDNTGAAVYDSSAFGVKISGALMHNCGSLQIPGFGTEGYYVQWGLSANSVLDGYFESSTANSNNIQGHTSVEGFLGTDFIGTYVVKKKGAVINRWYAATDGQGVSHVIGLKQRDSTLDAMFVRLVNPGAGGNLIGLTEQNYGNTEGRGGIYNNNWHEQFTQARNQPPYMQRWGADDRVFTSGTLNRGWRNYLGGVALTSPIIGDFMIQSGPNTTAIISNPYKPGDMVYNNIYTANQPRGWVCLTAGSVGPAVTAQGKTGAASNKIVLSAQSTILQEMDSILISGNAMRVTAKNKTEDTLTVSPAPPTISTFSAITYVAPTWMAFGQGFGNTAARPTLTTNDKGFWFYNTDSSRNEYWTGSAWNQLSATGGGGGTSYTFQQSIVNNTGTVNLVGDVTTPGNYQYYGTNGSGTRSYYGLPLVPDGAGNFAMGGAFATTRLYFNNNAASSTYFIQNNGGNFRYDGTTHNFWAGNINVFNLTSTNQSFLTKITLAAGTSTMAPAILTSGTNLATAVAGAVEYDGKVVYATPAGTQRGVIPAKQFVTVASGTVALSSATGLQAVFATANDEVSLSAGTTYRFDAVYLITKGTVTTCTVNTGFTFTTGTITSINYWANGTSASVDANATGQTVYVDRLASTGITNTGTATAAIIHITGTIVVSTAGTLMPQIAFSAAPGGTNTVNAGSYFEIWPVGTDTVTAVGAWQ
jgi:hypothetical protein